MEVRSFARVSFLQFCGGVPLPAAGLVDGAKLRASCEPEAEVTREVLLKEIFRTQLV